MAGKKDNDIDLQSLARDSGEDTVRRFRYVVPILKFNGNTGKFGLLIPDDSGNWVPEPIKKTAIEFVILKVRRVLSSYEKLPDGSGLRTFTNEHNSWKDSLTVFEMKKGDSKPRMIDSGTSQEIREKFTTLRLRQNLYCLFNDKVVKFTVRGKSLSTLFSFYQEFKANEHIFQFVTKIDSHEETNEGGLTYYVLDWDRGEESDLPEVAQNIKEIKESLDLLDKQYADMSSVPPEYKPEENGKKEKEGEEEVQVKDIPI